MLESREYQTVFKNRINESFTRVNSLLAVLPTGGGKTHIFSSLIQERVGYRAVVVHRREILTQISLSLAKFGVKHRIVAPRNTIRAIRKRHYKKLKNCYIDDNAQCGAISVQTLTSAATERDARTQRWLDQVSFSVFDEGHHYVKQGFWSRAVERMHNAQKLFVTATPERADGKGLGIHADGFAEEMIVGPSTQTLIDLGYLSPFVYKCPSTDLDMSNLPLTAKGDVDSKVLRARTIKSHLVGDVVKHYQQYANNKKCVVFASDVKTAEEIAEKFRMTGLNALALDGNTDAGVRDRAIDDFESGDLNILVNVDLFDEGFDVPGIEAVILARVTFSLAKYLQMVGRALRVMQGKTHAIIIDPVRNWERNGLPNWPRHWTLNARIKNGEGKPKITPLRECINCTQPYERYHLCCPYCGTTRPAPEGRSTPKQVDGDLIELDVNAMNEIFRRIDAAFMNDEDFREDLHRRHVPVIGHNRQLKAHQRAREHRETLKNMIGWWMGLQPKTRSLSEKQRRFYHRFNVDVGTALTLDEQQTLQLLNDLKINFTEDLI